MDEDDAAPEPWLDALGPYLAERGVRVKPARPMRLVTHLDVTAEGIERTVEAMQDFVATRASAPDAA